MTENEEKIAPSTEAEESQKKETPSPTPVKKSHALLWATLIFLMIGILWFCYWFFYAQFHESTDDAYANGSMVSINSAIEGSVIAFYADNTDLVTEGQLLIQLDTTPFLVAYEKELATMANVVLEVRQFLDTVKANKAIVESKQALVDKAKYDFENRSKLAETQAISHEDFIHAKDDLLVAQLALKQARFQYEVSKDSVGFTDPSKNPLIEQQRNSVRQAYYNLKHCSIYAPCTGYVAMRNVNVGESLIRDRNLMAIIPTDYVWVDANYKETQLSKMRIGQPAKVWFDLYGSDIVYEGKVLGIASGSGSVFSLIPPQNATGNWIKIVQRLPVRISLDPETLKNYPIRLGISAEVDVDITDHDLPMLATIPSTKVVTKTNVFDIDVGEVDKIIDGIIEKYLYKDHSE